MSDKHTLAWYESLAIRAKVKSLYRKGYFDKAGDYLLMWIDDAFKDKDTTEVIDLLRLAAVDFIVKLDRKKEALSGDDSRNGKKTTAKAKRPGKSASVDREKKKRLKKRARGNSRN